MSRSFTTKTGGKQRRNTSSRIVRSRTRATSRVAALGLAMGMVVAELSPTAAHAQATWVGDTSSDWNDASNWSTDPNPPTGNFTINNTAGPGIFPVISADSAFTPVDIFVGTGGATARVDHTAGTAGTGDGNWFFLGITGANATYNLADTTGSGGTYTGFGQGSGSLNVGGATQNGNLFVGLDAGTVSTLNINTTGTLATGGLMVGANGQSTGIVNLDSGTVNASGEVQIGSSFFGNGFSGALNVSGGTLTGDIIAFARGSNNAAAIQGTATITGGTLNSRRWFTLGFAGNASNTATVTNSGGTINVNTNTGGPGVLEMGVFDATTNVFTQNSGSVNLQNNASIGFGQGGNHTGTSTFDHNGGTVTFYSDSGTTVGGTGSVNLGNGGSTGTYVYNLNGGTLTVPAIRKAAAGASGTFNFNGGTLRAAGNSASFMTGLTAANVLDGGAVIDSNGFNVTVAQPLLAGGTGVGGLTKIGAGALTLSGASTYTGDTHVNDGTLALASGSSLASNVTVAAGKAFKAGTATVPNLSFPGAADLTIDMGSISTPGNPAPFMVSNTLSLGSGNVVVNVDHTGTWGVGTYDLVSAGSITGDSNQFVMGTVAGIGGRQSASIGTSGNVLQLTITGALPVWKGVASTNWSTNMADLAWDVNGTDGHFIDGDVVRFDNTAAGSTNVNVVGAVNPSLTTFDNSTLNYTLSGTGTVAGTGPLVKNGSGALTISNANTYSGGTQLNAGTLNINNANAIGSGALAVASGATIDNTSGSSVTLATNNAQTWSGDVTFGGTNALNMGTGAISRSGAGTVTVNGTAPVTLGGGIDGAGSLTKAGTGTLVLSGNNTYSGSTIVRAGTLGVAGGSTGSLATDANVVIAPEDTDTAAVEISGGTVNADRFIVAGNPANTTGGTATVTQTGGTINAARWFAVGNVGSATYNFSGGTINQNTAGGTQMEVAVFGAGNSTLNISGTAQLNLLNNANLSVGVVNNTGSGTVNQDGGTVTFYSDAGTTVGGTGNLILGQFGPTGTYTYNLNGGTLSTGSVTHSSGTGVLNLNGGTLKATRNDANLISNLSAANVGNGGAIIDTNGNNVRITQPLLAGGTGGLTKNGAGTLRLGGGTSTYTGDTTINGGTLQLAPGTTVTAVGVYSFDELAQGGPLAGGTTVANTGTGGAAMNGTVNDTNHLLGGGGASIVAGQFGNALALDGLGSSVDIADRIVDQAGGGSWTLSMWTRTTIPGSTMLSKDDGDGSWDSGDALFYLPNDQLAVGSGANLPTAVRWGGGWMQGNQPVADGTWHMLTFVSADGAKSIYVDGMAVPMSLTAFDNADPSTLVRLGFTHNTVAGDGSAHFSGDLDEVMFFDGALTATQVQSLFNTNTFTASSGQQYLPPTTAVSIPVSGAALDLNGNDQTIGSLAGVASSSVLLGAGTLTTGGNNASTTFAGTISGDGGLTKVGTGTFVLAASSNAYGGATTVSAGTLQIASGGGSNRVLHTGPVNITGTAQLDLTDNKLITTSPAGTATGGVYDGVQGLVQSGYNGGAWDGSGIISSLAPTVPAGQASTAIGVATGAQIKPALASDPSATALFAGHTITGSSTIAMYTYGGDANLDGLVSGDDYTAIDFAIAVPGASGWVNGDFNYDGIISGDDYTIIDFNVAAQGAPFPTSAAASTGVTAVPEPASLSLIGLCAAGLMRRRRRN